MGINRLNSTMMSQAQKFKRFLADDDRRVLLEVPLDGPADVDVIVERIDDHSFLIEEGNDGLIRVITVSPGTGGIPHSMWFPDRDTYDEWKKAAQEASDKFWNKVLWGTPKTIR